MKYLYILEREKKAKGPFFQFSIFADTAVLLCKMAREVPCFRVILTAGSRFHKPMGSDVF